MHGFDDAGLAELARSSVAVSRAPAELKARLLAGIDAWLTGPKGGTATSAERIT